MKKLLYILVLLTCAVRLTGVVVLSARGYSALPTAVITLTSLSVLHGIFLLVRKFVFSLHLRHFVQFFAAHSAVVAFNLALTSSTVLLTIDLPERLVIGTLLDILVGLTAVYYCLKSIRRNKYSRTKGAS